MRHERTVQASLFDLFAGHEIGRELKAMSAWLDDHRELAGLVAADLRHEGVKATGRQGLPAEAVLRCAVLKQYRQLSYQELAFHLEDSASFRAFARLPHAWSPQKSVLHRTISAIRAETWEQINRTLLASARAIKLERGRRVRLDSTVTAALIHEPSAWYDAMDMRMMGHGRAPGVEHGGDPDPRSEVLRVGGDRQQRLGRCLEQQVIDDRLVLVSEVGDRGRQGEDEVEVGHGQEIGFSLRQPVPCGGSLTLRAVAVAAGVVGDLGVGAVLTSA